MSEPNAPQGGQPEIIKPRLRYPRKNKGGRPSKYQELDTREILEKSLNVVRRFLTDESQPLDKRADVGMRFLAKHMPNKVEMVRVDLSLNDSIIDRLLSVIERNDAVRRVYSLPNNKIIDETAINSAINKEIMSDNNCYVKNEGEEGRIV